MEATQSKGIRAVFEGRETPQRGRRKKETGKTIINTEKAKGQACEKG